MSIAEKIEYIFSKIPSEELSDILITPDSSIGSYKILKEDILRCNILASENNEVNIKELMDCWGDSDNEISKEIMIKEIVDKCKNHKTIILTNADKSGEVEMKKFITFKNDNYMAYSVLIIEEAWGYSYFEIVHC